PRKGFRPFFARLFSSAARLDLSDLRTRVSVNGSASQKVYVDPFTLTRVRRSLRSSRAALENSRAKNGRNPFLGTSRPFPSGA
ncbi:hypothetical protein EXE48_18320, partial [Halorubrum sp. ASP1]|uniref:hypothetical protein n=1 Tax=Halorubrum sp. ASP1 TaxID=2518114 RepID=UPI0010F5BF9A